MKEIYSLLALRIGWFQKTRLEQGRFLFGTRLGFIDYDSHCYADKVKEVILITKTEMKKSKFLKHRCVRSKSITVDQLKSGTIREQYLIVRLITSIEMNQRKRAVAYH